MYYYLFSIESSSIEMFSETYIAFDHNPSQQELQDKAMEICQEIALGYLHQKIESGEISKELPKEEKNKLVQECCDQFVKLYRQIEEEEYLKNL